MADDPVVGLLKKSQFSFIGTVERLGSATMGDVPIDDRTAVVRVDQVLHAPAAFAQIAGSRVTLQLSADEGAPEKGSQWTFFATGAAFGESIALTEVGRLPMNQIEPHLARATQFGTSPLAEQQAEVEADRLRQHVSDADAVVVGRVTKLEKAGEMTFSEHDPDWWKATIDVQHVESGNVQPGEIDVLYPNSDDVQWHHAPKPKAHQTGMWVLHATEGDLRELAPYEILHPEDAQPVQHLEALRANGS